MAKKTKPEAPVATAGETRNFKMHPRLLMDVIERQAGTLHKAVLEGVMNAIDAGASLVEITLTDRRLTIQDNGSGITDKSVLTKYWETFGQPPDENEQKTYGYFRMGRGQLFAFGVNRWQTGPFAMTVDVANKGLDYELLEHPTCPVPGCRVEIDLYNRPHAIDIAQLARELEVSVKYVTATVTYNGNAVTVDTNKVKWDHVLDEAYIKLKDGGNLYVYNLGVLVCSHAGHVFGCGGEVVSRKQLKVNFARNEVMSDCPVWKVVKPIVNQRASQRVSRQPSMTDAGRQHIADQMINGDEIAGACEAKIITDVTGRHWSLRGIWPKHFHSRMTHADRGNRRGDVLMQQKLAFVMSIETLERFRVESVSELLPILRPYAYSPFGEFVPVDFDKITEGLGDRYELIPERDYTPPEQLVLGVVRLGVWLILQWLEEHEQRDTVATHRSLKLGLNEAADGWTDGSSYIAISRDYIKRTGVGLAAWGSYGCLLLHEYCHDDADDGSHIHTPEFYQKYHDMSVTILGAFVEECLRNVPRIQERLSRKRSVNQAQQATVVEKADRAAAAVAAKATT